MSDDLKRAVNETARLQLRTALLMSAASVVYNDDDDDAAKKKKDDDAKKDEAGQKLDKLLAGIDDIGKRLDRQDARMDSIEEKVKGDKKKDDDDDAKKRKDAMATGAIDDDDAKKRKDAEEEKKKEEEAKAKKDAEEKAKEEEEKAKAVVADKKRKDEEEEKKRNDARNDSVSKADLDEIRKLIPRQMTDEEFGKFSKVQERADAVFMAFGDSAPRPMQGEDLLDYRKRLLTKLQAHSPTWKDVNVRVLADETTLGIAEAQVYSDAARAAESPASLPEGKLLERVRVDASGRRISTFVGRGSFVRQFKRPARKVAKNNFGSYFNTDFRGR